MGDARTGVIIITFNEESNLEAALDSVKGFSQEVYVVDSFSTDRTVDIALSRMADGVQVVQHRFESYAAQWNWAINNLPIRSAWTLKLDSDERVTPEFKEEVSGLIQEAPDTLEGIYFRRRINFLGSWLKWGGMSDNYDLRMWRTGKAVFDNREVNEHAIVQGETVRINSFVDHCTHKSLTDWVDKHNKYSSLEAKCIIEGKLMGGVEPKIFGESDQRRAWLRTVYYRIPGRALIYFLYRYLFRLGFLDGRAGFQYAFLHAAFLYWIDLKLKENALTGHVPETLQPVRGPPHPEVAKSELQKLVDGADAGPDG